MSQLWTYNANSGGPMVHASVTIIDKPSKKPKQKPEPRPVVHPVLEHKGRPR